MWTRPKVNVDNGRAPHRRLQPNRQKYNRMVTSIVTRGGLTRTCIFHGFTQEITPEIRGVNRPAQPERPNNRTVANPGSPVIFLFRSIAVDGFLQPDMGLLMIPCQCVTHDTCVGQTSCRAPAPCTSTMNKFSSSSDIGRCCKVI